MIVLKRPTSWVQPVTLRIPQELVDHIVDYLRDEPASLRACSTICSTFLPRSSAYILRTLRLHTTQLIPFLPVLATSRRLSHYVVECHIVDDEARVLTPNALYNTILLLPRLQALVFVGPFRMFSSSTVLPPSRARHPLRSLRFEFLHVDLVESVLELFKRVDDLYINGRYIDGSLAAPRIVGEVRHLHVRLDSRYLCAMLKLFRPSCLASIELDCTPAAPVKPHDLDQFLQIYGAAIEKLTLKLPQAGVEPARSIASLGACAKLQEISLSMSAQRAHASLLPSVPPQVRRVRLDFTDAHGSFAHRCQWETLEAALAHAERLQVLELRFAAFDGAVPQDHADAIRGRLSPRLRRIVRMVVVG